jgi:hypothetical protein
MFRMRKKNLQNLIEYNAAGEARQALPSLPEPDALLMIAVPLAWLADLT